MEQYGLVVENKGDTATVNLQKHLACEKCGRCGILSGAGKRDEMIDAQNPIGAQVGQRVLMESDNRSMLLVSFVLYMVPLGGMVAGIFSWLALADFLGYAGDQDLPALGVGFGLMTLIFILIRLWDQRVKGNPRYQPVITELIEEENNDCSE